MAEHARYLPSGAEAELEAILGEDFSLVAGDTDVVYRLIRMLEKYYALGYSDGHTRGYGLAWSLSRAKRRASDKKEGP
jgi:hypothetical protein